MKQLHSFKLLVSFFFYACACTLIGVLLSMIPIEYQWIQAMNIMRAWCVVPTLVYSLFSLAIDLIVKNKRILILLEFPLFFIIFGVFYYFIHTFLVQGQLENSLIIQNFVFLPLMIGCISFVLYDVFKKTFTS